MADNTTAQWVNLDTLQLWERNYNQGDVGAIVQSIRKFGFDNALRVWHGTVMAGNHSTIALRQLVTSGWMPFGGAVRMQGDDVQVLIVDISHLSQEQAQAFAIADNRTAQLAEPDEYALAELLQELANSEDDTLLDATGYDGDDLDNLLRDLAGDYPPDSGDDGLYTRTVETPIYEPSENKPSIKDLFDDTKTKHLIDAIENSYELTPDEKVFLIIASQRHTVLNFSKIADYYAHSSLPIQRLMEDNALVIIDFNRAIELGFVKLTQQIADLEHDDYG